MLSYDATFPRTILLNEAGDLYPQLFYMSDIDSSSSDRSISQKICCVEDFWASLLKRQDL